jgi:hypothetical protein
MTSTLHKPVQPKIITRFILPDSPGFDGLQNGSVLILKNERLVIRAPEGPVMPDLTHKHYKAVAGPSSDSLGYLPGSEFITLTSYIKVCTKESLRNETLLADLINNARKVA